MKKSLSEILEVSFNAFRKSFWTIVGLYLGIFLMMFLCGIFAALSIGKEGLMSLAAIASAGDAAPQMMSVFIASHIPQLSVLLLIFLFFALACCVIGFWTVLIVRNNVLVEKNLVKESFKEVFGKILKLIALTIIISIISIFGFWMLVMLSKKLAIICFFLLPLFLAPMGFTVYYGVLCRQGNFWEVISDSFKLGFHNWFRIIGYGILFFIAAMIFFTVTMIPIYFLSKGNTALGQIVNAVVQYAFSIFVTCLGTVFYLDLAGMVPQIPAEHPAAIENQPAPQENITK